MQKLKKLHNFRVVLVVLLLVAMLFLTNPERLPLVFLILPFVLIFILFWIILDMVLARKSEGLVPKNKKVIVVIMASVPVLLLVLQSIGQLSIRDLLIIIGLSAGLVFYFAKTNLLQ